MSQQLAPAPLDVAFAAGTAGPWRIDRINSVAGEILSAAARLAVFENGSVAPDARPAAPPAAWAAT